MKWLLLALDVLGKILVFLKTPRQDSVATRMNNRTVRDQKAAERETHKQQRTEAIDGLESGS